MGRAGSDGTYFLEMTTLWSRRGSPVCGNHHMVLRSELHIVQGYLVLFCVV